MKKKGLYGGMEREKENAYTGEWMRKKEWGWGWGLMIWGESSLLSQDKGPLGLFVLAIYRFVSFKVISQFRIDQDPKTFSETMSSQDVSFWKEAVQYEMDSIVGNYTWELTDFPIGCKPFSCKWIFKKKMKVIGPIVKFTARLVIQGFRQENVSIFSIPTRLWCESLPLGCWLPWRQYMT